MLPPMSMLTDPLGRRIELSDATWHRHILKGHPEMRGGRREAESALAAPIAIHVSSSDPDCRLYYGRSPRPRLMICVVADVAAGRVKKRLT
jgi:hypothetical protein